MSRQRNSKIKSQTRQRTQEELESYLWDASNILRGSIDSGEYKHYIFGLLFYKRLCDVWNEDFLLLLEQNGGNILQASDPKAHHFHIPFGCMWYEERRPEPTDEQWTKKQNKEKKPKTIRAWPSDLGTALKMAFQKIEEANPRLQGVFQDVDFTHKERFPDEMILQLLQHFEKYRMQRSDVDANILGNAYEYLIAKFADDAGKKGGEFYTPKEVVRLMVEILQPKEEESLYDPSCGSGGMLLEAMQYIKRTQPSFKQCTLYGQEKNINTWAICTMSLFLHDIEHSFIARGDTIADPKHLSSDSALKQFDIILANPPFSLKKWENQTWNRTSGDRFGRSSFGSPPKGYGDYAFIQHMIHSMTPEGRMGVVVPMGVLFRSGSEQPIRKNIIEEDLIDCIVGLGPNLFYGASIPAAIMFMSKKKNSSMKDRILFVNAEQEVTIGTAQNHLSKKNIEQIVDVVLHYKEKDLFSRIVEKEELIENDYNLNIVRYVQTTPPPPMIDIQASFQKLTVLKKQQDDEFQRFCALFLELGND